MKFEEAVTEDTIRAMVYSFYDKVRKDELLAPIFEHSLSQGWDAHLPHMVDFWSRVLLGTTRFEGNVYGKHMALNGITDEHFVHWLAHFKETAAELFEDDVASEIVVIADRIATSLRMGFADRRARESGVAPARIRRFSLIAEPEQ
jgi:hemoglobin